MIASPRKKTTLDSRLQVPREWDGLVGRNEGERREIAERIDRVSSAKTRIVRDEGTPRELTPFEIALALGADARSGRRRCSGCSAWLPATAEYFNRNGGDALHGKCKPCMARYNARYKAAHKARMTAEDLERKRASSRESVRRLRARRKAESIPECHTARDRLRKEKYAARKRMERATDPARIAYHEARLLSVIGEIERLKQVEACAG